MNQVITVGRQYGSGGTEMGRLLAKKLQVPCYDKSTLRQYAIEEGLGKTLLDSYNNKNASSLLLSLSTGAYSFGYYDASQGAAIGQKAYLTAFETVKEVSRLGPCVIVGRCADYVLKGHPRCLSIFVHAPLPYRVDAIMKREDLGREEAYFRIQEQDRLRRNYYNYYTTREWGDVNSYHLTLDSSLFGVEQGAELVARIVELEAGDYIPTGDAAG